MEPLILRHLNGNSYSDVYAPTLTLTDRGYGAKLSVYAIGNQAEMTLTVEDMSKVRAWMAGWEDTPPPGDT